MLYITRREHFSSSHKLINKSLSHDENEDLFGKCFSLHGHNYYLEVTIEGTVNPESGYVMDLKILKEILFSRIISKVDHKFLNDVEMFKNIIPTTENIAVVFWNILKDLLYSDNYRLYSIKIYETEKNFVIYKGDE